MEDLIKVETVIPGDLSGELLVSSDPLSFWGGYEPTTGEITDRRHPLSGVKAADKVLALPFTRGSSTTTAVLLEAQRLGKAPQGLLTIGVDSFLALASIVADELYRQPIPVYALRKDDFFELKTGYHVRLVDENHLKVTRVG